jgi:SAM-dependent methyltransferase
VWEPAGARLLNVLGDGTDKRVLDVGCGCLGWLRILSKWVGSGGVVVGTDISESMARAAQELISAERLQNANVVLDDLFASALPPLSFDLVHARFQLAPLGKFDEQLAAYARLLAPGGTLVLEDPDTASWTFTPELPNTRQLILAILAAFRAAGGDFDAGRIGFDLLTRAGFEPQVRAEVVALEPGHPYLQLPLQFAASLRPRLLERFAAPELDALVASVVHELARPHVRGLSFTLMQTWGQVP